MPCAGRCHAESAVISSRGLYRSPAALRHLPDTRYIGSRLEERIARGFDAVHSRDRIEDDVLLLAHIVRSDFQQIDFAEGGLRTLLGPADRGVVNSVTMPGQLYPRAGCRKIRMPGSIRGMWKPSYGRATKAPPDEKRRQQTCPAYRHRTTSPLYPSRPISTSCGLVRFGQFGSLSTRESRSGCRWHDASAQRTACLGRLLSTASTICVVGAGQKADPGHAAAGNLANVG